MKTNHAIKPWKVLKASFRMVQMNMKNDIMNQAVIIIIVVTINIITDYIIIIVINTSIIKLEANILNLCMYGKLVTRLSGFHYFHYSL